MTEDSSKPIAFKAAKTLQQAIHDAQMAVEYDTEFIVVQRDHYKASLNGKRAREEDEDLNQQFTASQWKEKYQQLRIAHSIDQRESVAQMGKILDKYDNLRLYSQLMESKLQESSRLHSQCQRMSKILRFYEQMTGMHVEIDEGPADKDRDVYTCTVRNEVDRKALRFTMSTKVEQSSSSSGGLSSSSSSGSGSSSNEEEMCFNPVANVNFFPEYLQSEIMGELKMAPVIMGDILQGLYADENVPDEGES